MDGLVLRAEILAAIRAEAGSLSPPAGLATVVVGDNPRCHAFARDKRSAAAEAGIAAVAVGLSAATTQDDFDMALAALAIDPAIDGIFVQLPLPAHLRLAEDVDGLLPPTTPDAILRLLDRYDIPLDGRRVVIVGDHPGLGPRFTTRNAHVSLTDRDTIDDPFPAACRAADILVVTVGQPRSITADHVGPGATVIDVVGAVDNPSVATVAAALAPYPTSVGPVALAYLLRHTLDAALAR